MIDPDVLFGITTYKPSLPSATNYSQFRALAHRHTSTPPTHCRPILHLSGSLVARLRIILFTERGKDAPRGLERPAGVQDGPVVDEEDVAVCCHGTATHSSSRILPHRRSRRRGRASRPLPKVTAFTGSFSFRASFHGSTRCRRPPCC